MRKRIAGRDKCHGLRQDLISTPNPREAKCDLQSRRSIDGCHSMPASRVPSDHLLELSDACSYRRYKVRIDAFDDVLSLVADKDGPVERDRIPTVDLTDESNQ
jgi:hypothetical protein